MPFCPNYIFKLRRSKNVFWFTGDERLFNLNTRAYVYLFSRICNVCCNPDFTFSYSRVGVFGLGVFPDHAEVNFRPSFSSHHHVGVDLGDGLTGKECKYYFLSFIFCYCLSFLLLTCLWLCFCLKAWASVSLCEAFVVHFVWMKLIE